MSKETQYKNNRLKILENDSVCKENKILFKEFLKQKEYNLKRRNGIPNLTETQYKTLAKDVSQLKNINHWFLKPIADLTKADIKKVYDGLEDEKLKSIRGAIIKTKTDYYDKFFKSLLFKIAGKDHLSKEIIIPSKKSDQEVRFFEEDTHRKIVSVVNTQIKKLLY